MANPSPRYRSLRDGSDLNRRYQQMLKQETPPYEQQLWETGPADLGLPQQFSNMTSPQSDGSPRWNDHYIAQTTAPQQQGYVTYDDGGYVDTGLLDGQLYGYSGQYSGVSVDPTQIATTQAGIQPQMYGQTTQGLADWDTNMITSNGLGMDYSQPENGTMMQAYDTSGFDNSGLNSMFPGNGMYDDGTSGLAFQPYQTPPMEDDKARVELQDSEYNDDWEQPVVEVPYRSPPTTLDHTPASIMEWFNTHYASRLGEENLPAPGSEIPDNYGEVICRLCHPAVSINYLDYKQHKLEFHGLKKHHNESVRLDPPYHVRLVKQPNNVQAFEGFCTTCRQWVPLDVKVVGYNWSSHARQCQNTMLGRYISSSDEEPDVIEKAKKHPPLPFLAASNAGKPSGNRSSEGSTGSSAWSSITDGSSQSAHSGTSLNSAISNMSTRSLQQRRKAALRVRARKNTKQSNQKRPYQCTFCKADFVSFGDWRRHEENIHLVLSKWVCAPAGMYKPGTKECVYCDTVHTANTNGVSNRCNANYCHAKSPDDRVFSRKDHLKQHLKKIHGVAWKDSFEKWCVKSSGPSKSRCGFCGATFDSWHQRMQHVGYEFKSGHRMELWQGDWGLDAYWMSTERLGGVILPMDRDDHQSKLKRTSTGGTGASRRLSTYNPAAKALKPKLKLNDGPNPKQKLTKKPNFESLRGGGDHYSMASTHDADIEDNFGHDFHDFTSPPQHYPDPPSQGYAPDQHVSLNDADDPFAFYTEPFPPYAHQLNTPPESNANHDSESHIESSPLYTQQTHQQQLPTPQRHTPQRQMQQQQQQQHTPQQRYQPIFPGPPPNQQAQNVWMSPPISAGPRSRSSSGNQAPLGVRMGFNAAAAANASMAVAAAVGEHGGYLAERQQQVQMMRQHQNGPAVAYGVIGNGGGETVFSCPACDKRFTRQDNLRRHMQKSHSASPEFNALGR